MIEVRDLVKSYGPTQALKGISFAVPRGQVVGFLGPNGAGKTTTMRVLAGFVRATAGEALIQGRRVAEDSLHTRSLIGYLPENAPLYDDMMVVELLELAAELRAVPRARRGERLRAMVAVCGLGDVLGRDVGELSKGFRQRVGLAQALIHDPDVLILDEPTSGLDPNQIAEIRGLVRELGRDKTVVLSTHILPEVQATCDRVIIIAEGRLKADFTVASLTGGASQGRYHVLLASRTGAALEAAAVQGALADLDSVERASLTPGEEAGTLRAVVDATAGRDPRRELFEAALALDLAVLELRREAVSLEETFRRLTAEPGAADA